MVEQKDGVWVKRDSQQELLKHFNRLNTEESIAQKAEFDEKALKQFERQLAQSHHHEGKQPNFFIVKPSAQEKLIQQESQKYQAETNTELATVGCMHCMELMQIEARRNGIAVTPVQKAPTKQQMYGSWGGAYSSQAVAAQVNYGGAQAANYGMQSSAPYMQAPTGRLQLYQ